MEEQIAGVHLEPVEAIDYTSTSFILQNLRLRNAQLSEESEKMLTARKDVASCVTLQLSFYIYCILHAFNSKFESLKPPKEESTGGTRVNGILKVGENPGPMVLIVGGTGYIAQHTIDFLTRHGMKSRLLIFCRGEIFLPHYH